jgi:thiol-disulfide isomerase/thioredoxin
MAPNPVTPGLPATARLPVLGRAPELLGVRPWLNTPGGHPLTPDALRRRVVLIEFWTFACPNCQRTLPFLRQMHGRYRPRLAVIGVHTPEFPFERAPQNVASAVREQGLDFPVVLDNDYVAWNAYRNRGWPSLYLVDRAGRLRYRHIGEGDYQVTEAAINELLAEADTILLSTEGTLSET